jgi:hypothetical protein
MQVQNAVATGLRPVDLAPLFEPKKTAHRAVATAAAVNDRGYNYCGCSRSR